MKLFSKVKLITDKYSGDGVKENSIGIVLEVYDTGDYEVQFLDKHGESSDVFSQLIQMKSQVLLTN